MIYEQSSAITNTLSTKQQHKLICGLREIPTHGRLHLTGKRPHQLRQEPKQQQGTPSYCLHTTTFKWRNLTTGGTCIIQPLRRQGRSYSQCCCVAFSGGVRCNRNHSYLFLVLVIMRALVTSISMYVCMYVCVPTKIQ